MRPLSMADMFWNMKKKSGLEMAIWSAKTAFLLIGFAAAVVFASLAVASSLGLLLCSLWIVIQIIIVAIWKLSDAKPHGDQPHHPEVPVAPPPDSPETWYDVPSSPTTSTASSPEFKSSLPPEHVNPPEPSVTEAAASSPDDGSNNSLDGIWRAVMEGGGLPAKPALRKSGTWERRQNVAEEAVARREMSKSKTFKKEEGWRRRDVLVVRQDELFLRVETLIKKHHDHLRIQRQESEQRRFLERLRHIY
ncbi:uncharacterized protein LOC103712489 [Phoenix dactylifera]|uniref:Uncharacterized protein LOC103712489 n=1 Tax=Phoenix dactylifera TaxID=42345 RepID=A0A8B7CDZ2_PHODC|nr:uncharacterized protein LOC103712489 [Phoenix dactylifera]